MYEEAADSRRYPASVAKVMTLYVLFQELSAGNIKLSTKMTVSAHAAAAVPTKLGLRAGATITVEDAIKSLVTLSANDMARVIAEHISGTESKFAERMAQSAEWPLFDYVTSPNAMPVGVEFKKAAREVSGLDSLTAFLAAYKQTYATDPGLTPAEPTPPSEV